MLLTACANGAGVFPVGSYVALEQDEITNASDYPDGYGQTFTLTEDITIIGIELSVWGMSGGKAFTLELHRFDAASVSLDSSILGSGQVALSEISTELAWTPVILDRAVEGKAGDMFAFTHRGDPVADGFNRYGNSQLDPYDGGSRFGGYGFGESGFDQISPFLANDYAFRIIVIPESGTVFLTALGVGCLLGRRRRSVVLCLT